jgi:phage baseplate assembly protein W
MKPDLESLAFSVFVRGSAYKTKLLDFVSPEEQIRQSLLFILSTDKGERPLMEDYGTTLKNFIFRRNSDGLLTEIEAHVRESLSQHETRVTIDEVKAERVDDSRNRIELQIRYRVNGTDLRQTLRFPLGLMS